MPVQRFFDLGVSGILFLNGISLKILFREGQNIGARILLTAAIPDCMVYYCQNKRI